MEAEEVEKWISSENILVAAEEDVFRIILKWIEQNKGERKDKFEQLFRHIRLVMLSRDCLFSDIVTNELVTEHFSILRRVTDAIKLVRATSEDTQIQPARRRLETHAIVVRGGKKTYCYLPEKDEWKRLADGLSEDRNHTTQMINFRDQLFSFPRSRYADTERYDPVFNSWMVLRLSRPFEKVSLAVLNGKIHAIYRPGRGAIPVIERYDVELCTGRLSHLLRTSTTAMNRVSLPLATVCMFLVDVVKKLADLTLWKTNGRTLHRCKLG